MMLRSAHYPAAFKLHKHIVVFSAWRGLCVRSIEHNVLQLYLVADYEAENFN